MDVDKDTLAAAAVGGMAIGLGSSIPIIGLGNCLCCGWIWGGGVVAVVAHTRMSGRPCEAGKGIWLGLLAGLVGAVIIVVVQTGMQLIGMNNVTESIRQSLEKINVEEMVQQQRPENREKVREIIVYLKNMDPRKAFWGFLIGLSLVWTILAVVFGMFGGLLGALFAGGSQGDDEAPLPPG